MPEFSENQTTQLDTIITNETQKFLDSLTKEDFSIGWFFGNLTITPIKNRIKNFLTSQDIGDNITNFVGLNFLGKLIVKPELIDRVNIFKKEIISMRMRYTVENIIPTNEELNQLRETIGVTKRTAEDSQKLRQKVNNGQQNPPSSNPRPPQQKEKQEGETIPRKKVEEVRNYIVNGGKYHSYTLWNITRWEGVYKHVCTTWAYEVASRLTWYPRPENTDWNGYDEKLKAMHYTKIMDKVNPKCPVPYLPKDWDVAVRPQFTLDNGKTTQHMATYINWHRVSDTIQKHMSCYSTANEPCVKIYRYTPESDEDVYYRLAA